MQKQLKTTHVFIMFLLIAGIISSCTGQTNKGTISIAVAESNPITENGANAHSLYAGARLAAEQANEAGGVNGYFIKIVPYATEKSLNLTNEILPGYYPLSTNQVPRASELIQSGLYGIVTHKFSAQKAADLLQAGMAEWYEPAQACNQ